jgi:hypothetical protein
VILLFLQIASIFIVSGAIKFAKSRADCHCRLYRISEECHAKVRVGNDGDGISYQSTSSEHLRFRLVFKEEFQAEDFRIAVKKIPNAYRKRKIDEESPIVPDICVELQEIARENYNDNFLLVEEEQYERIAEDQDPSPNYDPNSYSEASAVSITEATRLRLLSSRVRKG